MGKYINSTSDGKGFKTAQFIDKYLALVGDGANEIFGEIKFQKDLICLVDNGWMSAIGYAYSEDEMKVFLSPDGRNKKWFIYEHAEKLAQ